MLKNNSGVLLFSAAMLFVTVFLTQLTKSSLIQNIQSEQADIKSPYHELIDELLEKGKVGISPNESKKLSELIVKNNEWYEDYNSKHLPAMEAGLIQAYSKSSTEVTVYIFFGWFISAFLFLHFGLIKNIHYSLIFPIFASFLRIISFYELISIAIAVCLVWLIFDLRQNRKRGNQ